jgi:hypothetical protein
VSHAIPNEARERLTPHLVCAEREALARLRSQLDG